ncbi:MAG TPA: PASTA domain-containing protein [Gaiellaceae bacterium]
MPRLVGLSAPLALTRLRQLGLTGSTHSVFSDKPRNVVVAQKPGSSRKLARGETVNLRVSKGPRSVATPDVVGQTVADAMSTLRAQAFELRIVRVPSVEPAGQVVAQHPKADAKAQPGTVVRLNVSDGTQATPTGTEGTPTTSADTATNVETAPTTRAAPANASALVRVPELEGKKVIDARRLARRVALVIEIRRVPNAQPLDTVISQAKRPGTRIERGTHLLITVSTGPQPSTATTSSQSRSQPIAVPDVTGEDETMATQDLDNAGLTVRVVDRDTPDATQDGLVIEQTPDANQQAQLNSTVTIYVGRYASS